MRRGAGGADIAEVVRGSGASGCAVMFWRGSVAEAVLGNAGGTMTALDRAGGNSAVLGANVVVLPIIGDEAGAVGVAGGVEGMCDGCRVVCGVMAAAGMQAAGMSVS